MKKLLTIGVAILLIGIGGIPSISSIKVDKTTEPISTGNILYVGGDGPDNYSKIQDAINNASGGDTVFVYNGMYQESDISVDKGITLIGENKNKTIIDGLWSLVIFFINVSNVTVRNFTLKNTSGSGFGQAILIRKYPIQGRIKNICISDCIITNDDKGIAFVDAYNVSISSCYFNHNTAQSIIAHDSSNFQITTCIINNSGIETDGEVYRSGGISFHVSPYQGYSNISISNCVIHDNIGNGIFLSEPRENIEIYQNLVYKNTRDGIICQAYGQDITDIDIYQNSVYGNSNSGISVKGISQPGARIHDNNVSSNGPDPILTGFEAGIYVHGSTNSVTVENNVLYNNNADGIQIRYSPDVTITKNKVVGTRKTGIYISTGSNNATVRHNILQEDKDEGLYVGSFSSNISENVFSNNEIGLVVGGKDNVVYKNRISNNNLGARIHGYIEEIDNTTTSSNVRIICNNFLNNDKDAFFKYYHCFPRGSGNIIENNFWGKPRMFPKIIFGQLCCPFKILDNPFLNIPWITFDWTPTNEAYDI
jgi:parallel beta-helix repeat protein